MTKKNDTPNKSRRSTLKKVAAGSALGLFGGLLLSKPRKADAFVWEIPQAVIAFFRTTKEYYDEFLKEWVDKAKELSDMYTKDPVGAVASVVSDSANELANAIDESEYRREVAPPPSDQCAGENAGKAKTYSRILHDETEKKNASESLQQFADAIVDGRNAAKSLREHINQRLGSQTIEGALESLNGIVFIGDRGYEKAQSMDSFVFALMSRSKVQLALRTKDNAYSVSRAGQLQARLSTVEENLNFIKMRRVRTKAAYEQAYLSALPYEQSILHTLSSEEGISEVDLENFQIARTHASADWQDWVAESPSATALTKELLLLKTEGNDLDSKILDVQRRIAQVSAISALSATETENSPSGSYAHANTMNQGAYESV
ncbi:hypothetical protein [Idiomarina abyssalis]|uniref:Uncharacterized protein n=1 Tax=Idiomarina abyssalis TaxID=86102 RepID=A0A8I1KK75_9GAMM|nr:hypothetical protein [Idiomarina abyssalis]MBJ7265477.1 hypothetical protein [Idiomarina abyssalis]MBJ7316849.1 hypothetical protein [Idiomarina abyssalis]